MTGHYGKPKPDKKIYVQLYVNDTHVSADTLFKAVVVSDVFASARKDKAEKDDIVKNFQTSRWRTNPDGRVPIMIVF